MTNLHINFNEALKSLKLTDILQNKVSENDSVSKEIFADVIRKISNFRTTRNNLVTELLDEKYNTVSKNCAYEYIAKALMLEPCYGGKSTPWIAALMQKGIISDEDLSQDKAINYRELVQLLGSLVSFVFDEPKEYNTSVKGNTIVNVSNVILKDMTIDGDLILLEGVTDGDLTLENVTVKGNLISKAKIRPTIILIKSSVNGEFIVGKTSHLVKIAGKLTSLRVGTDVYITGEDNEIAEVSAAARYGFEVEKVDVLQDGKKACYKADQVKLNRNELQISVKIKGLNVFATGHTIYRLEPITLKTGRGIVGYSYYGAVVAFTDKGEKVWEYDGINASVHKLVVADINGDGKDEVILAGTDNFAYALDNNGKLLWKFETKAPLYACEVVNEENKTFVFVGGVDHFLYKLDQNGNLLEKREMINKMGAQSPTSNSHSTDKVAIRHLEAGKIGNKTYLVVATALHGSAVNAILMIDPLNINENIWYKDYGPAKTLNRFLGRIAVGDINSDGKFEILLGHASSPKGGAVTILDSDGNNLVEFSDQNKMLKGRGYRMSSVNQFGDKIINLYGYDMVVYDNTGKELAIKRSDLAYTDAVYDPVTKNYYLGSDQSGGDSIAVIDTTSTDWTNCFTAIEAVGRQEEVINNLILAYKQIQNFKKPSYQKKVNDGVIITTGDAKSQAKITKKYAPNGSIFFSTYEEEWTQNFDRKDLDPVFQAKRDHRRRYDYSCEDLVNMAKSYEDAGVNFSVWAGHGTDPFYIQPATVIKMLDAAPTRLKLLVYAELGGTGKQIEYLGKNLFTPIAKACRKQGTTKIMIRTKNIFWACDALDPAWQDILYGEYSDVFVSSMEETNSRAQELSVPSRMGLWYTDACSTWGGRLIEDNTNYVRQFEWGVQRVHSHFIRNFLYQLVNGSKVAQNGCGLYGENALGTDYDQTAIIYSLIDKGIAIIPKKEDIVSVPDLVIRLKSPLDEDYVNTSESGHAFAMFNSEDKSEYMFDNIEDYYGGGPIRDYDLSKYVYGATSRRNNFMPENPYGMVLIISERYNLSGTRFKDSVLSDGKYFYDGDKKYTPSEYKKTVIEKLKKSASKLPVLVSGNEVAWSACKVDDNHVRLTLIDGGYVTPADRKATVLLQGIKGKSAVNILSNKKYDIVGNKIIVTVPAGVFSIIDIEI